MKQIIPVILFLIISNLAPAYNSTELARSTALLLTHQFIPRYLDNIPGLQGAQFGADFTFGLKAPTLISSGLLLRHLMTADAASLTAAQSLGNMVAADLLSENLGVQKSFASSIVLSANLFAVPYLPKAAQNNILDFKLIASMFNIEESLLSEFGIEANMARLATGLTAGISGLALARNSQVEQRHLWATALMIESGLRVVPSIFSIDYKATVGIPIMVLANYYLLTRPHDQTKPSRQAAAIGTFISATGNILACMSLGDLISYGLELVAKQTN